MNPLTNVKNLNKLNERELQIGSTNTSQSWHNKYKDSAWIYIGGLDYDLTEGDVVCVFSQYGEIVNVNLLRDPKTGKSRGFAFLCYEDQRSTILAVDNLNGARVTGRILRVEHVEVYRLPKELQPDQGNKKKANKKDELRNTADLDPLRKTLLEKGCAPEVMEDIANIDTELQKRMRDAQRQRQPSDLHDVGKDSVKSQSPRRHRNDKKSERDDRPSNRHDRHRSRSRSGSSRHKKSRHSSHKRKERYHTRH